jgi:hypothetical protein
MRRLFDCGLVGLVMVCCAGPASAVAVGLLDNFQDGSTQSWGSGAAHPSPPVNVAGGGPAGAADNYLLITATGLTAPGGKLVAINPAQWSGDYFSAGVDSIVMDVRNFGSSELSLRLAFFDALGAVVVTTPAVSLSSGSTWTHAAFSLDPALLSGDAASVLANVVSLRLFHSSTAAYPGQNISAVLGLDNISAVPEPTNAAMLLTGWMALLALRRRQRRQRGT